MTYLKRQFCRFISSWLVYQAVRWTPSGDSRTFVAFNNLIDAMNADDDEDHKEFNTHLKSKA